MFFVRVNNWFNNLPHYLIIFYEWYCHLTCCTLSIVRFHVRLLDLSCFLVFLWIQSSFVYFSCSFGLRIEDRASFRALSKPKGIHLKLEAIQWSSVGGRAVHRRWWNILCKESERLTEVILSAVTVPFVTTSSSTAVKFVGPELDLVHRIMNSIFPAQRVSLSAWTLALDVWNATRRVEALMHFWHRLC